MKKVLSLVLVIAMVLSSMSFAFAAKFEDVADNDYEKAINTLAALKVIDGYDDGTFKPEKTITRAEMAKLMVQLLGYGDLVAGSKSNFTDTQGHWADPYIALAAGKGLVLGTGDGKFTPDRTVSYDEVLTMLVRGLGYTDDCNEIKGTWPSNFKVKAAELGITKNVKVNSTGADRGGVAQAMFNALEAKIVTVDNDKNVKDVVDSKNKTKELLSRIAELDESYNVTADKIDPNNKNYAGSYVDLASYMYQNLEVYLNDDDEVVYIKDTNSLVIEGSIDEVTASKDGKTVTVAIETADGSIKKVDFSSKDAKGVDEKISASIFENRAAKNASTTYKYLEDETETIKLVANEGEKSNGKIEESEVDGFVLETQTSVVRVEDVYEKGDVTLEGLTLPTNSKDEVDFTKVIVKGAADSLEDIKADDIVVEYLAEDDEFTTLVVSRETVEGEVTRQGGTDVYVDGTKYKLSETAGAASAPEIGDSGIFYLDHNGKIADYDTEVSDGATDYAVVMGVEAGTVKDSFGKVSIDDYPQIKITNQSGDEIVYDMYVKVDSNNKISNSAKLGTESLFSGTLVKGNEITSAKFEGLDDLVNTHPQIIKYKLNSDKKVTKIELVDAKELTSVDTTKSSFKLLSDALVYDYQKLESVDQSKLSSKIATGYAVYNKKGEIEVLLVRTSDVDDSVYTFAYVTSVNNAKNNGDNVQAVKAYVDGKYSTEIFTDSDDVFPTSGGTKKVYALDMDGTVITEATAATPSGITLGRKTLTIYSGTVQDKGSDTIKINGSWETLSDDATVIGIDSNGDVNAVRKLNTIRNDKTNVDVYMYNGYVVYVVIYE